MFCISWFSKLERKTGDDRWDGALSLHRLVSYHFHVSPAIQYPWGYDVETPRVIYGAFYLPNELSLFQSFLACLSIFLPGACRSSTVLFSQKSCFGLYEENKWVQGAHRLYQPTLRMRKTISLTQCPTYLPNTGLSVLGLKLSWSSYFFFPRETMR